MQFTIAGKELAEFLNLADSSIKSAETASHSGHVMVRADVITGVRMYVDDVGVSIEGAIAAEVQHGGVLMLPGKSLQRIAKRHAEDVLRFKLGTGGTMVISAGKPEHEVSYAPAESFPLKKGPLESSYIDFDGSILTDAIKRAVKSVGEKFNDWRDGVTVEFSGEAIKAFSSNGHRMFEYKAPFPLVERITIVIPSRACREIANLELFNQVAFTKGAIWLRNEKYTVSLGLMDGDTPWIDFDRVEQASGKLAVAKISTAKLRAAVKSVTVLAENHNDLLKLQLNFNPDMLMMVAEDKATKRRSFDAFGIEYSGAPFSYPLNRHYLLDALDQLGCDEVEFILPAQPNYPVLLKRPSQENGASVRACILGYTA